MFLAILKKKSNRCIAQGPALQHPKALKVKNLRSAKQMDKVAAISDATYQALKKVLDETVARDCLVSRIDFSESHTIHKVTREALMVRTISQCPITVGA